MGKFERQKLPSARYVSAPLNRYVLRSAVGKRNKLEPFVMRLVRSLSFDPVQL
jgi:hypothetical protein